MTTVFIGGSRHVSRLTAPVRERLNSIIDKRHMVVVGDANGADKAVQKHFAEAAYDAVTVYCAGERPRNRLADWPVHKVTPPNAAKGFQFYAAKDREMAADADVGLMIWDGKSPGTVLNVLRLVQAGKIAVLVNMAEKSTRNVKSAELWRDFLAHCSFEFREELKARATPDEWAFAAPESQLGLSLDRDAHAAAPGIDAHAKEPAPVAVAWPEAINAALLKGDAAAFIEVLGHLSREKGMSRIARDTGLSRESLYRSLGSGGNPEFATIMKVISALGLKLEANAHQLPQTGRLNDHHTRLPSSGGLPTSHIDESIDATEVR